MAISIFGALPAKAENSVSEPEPQIKTDVSVEGTDSFGNLLTSELSKEMDRQEENNGCNIFSIEMNGADATVSFETTEDCTLVVAVYDESGEQMFASGNVAVVNGETEKTVTIETESMPQFYFLRGFLVDSDTFRPVCTSYESPNYTQEMQEFFAKTVNDFDSEKVLNLDASESNNFVVFSNETIIIEQNGTTNCVTKADDNTRTYVITNADDMVKSLKNGDIFTCKNGNETLIVKVDKISVVGSTVTITGQETSMEEVFEYVKIDESQDTNKVTVDDSNLPDGVTYNGTVDSSKQQRSSSSFNQSLVRASECEWTMGNSLSFTFESPNVGSDNLSVNISGSLNFMNEVTLKYYISLKHQYLELKFDYKTEISIKAKASIKACEIKLADLNYAIVPGVNIGITPKFVVKISGLVELSGTLTGIVGFRVSNDEGMKNISSTPHFEAELKAEVTVFIGVILEPNINIINSSVAKVGMEAEVGAEIKACNNLLEFASSTHACRECIDGDISAKWSLSFNAQLLNFENLKFKYTAYEMTHKLSDFYYSLGKNEFGWGECPYKQYRVNVRAVDTNRNPISETSIIKNDPIGDIFLGKTDSNGNLEIWLSNGDYILTAGKGNVTTTRGITVHDDAKSVVIHLEDTIQESESNIAAVDLIDKTMPEIISLMNGEYQIIQTEMGGYYNGTYSGIFYIQNQSIFPGMEFYSTVPYDESVKCSPMSEYPGEEIQSDELRRNLEAGKYALEAMQVNKSGKVSNTIQAGMDYKSCSKALGDFDCIPGNGGYIGGSVVSVSHTYNEKNAKVILHFFDIPSEIMQSLVYKGQSVSSEEMKLYNPELENVVIRKDKANINSVLLSERAVPTVESNNTLSLSNIYESKSVLKQSPILLADQEYGASIISDSTSKYSGLYSNEIYNFYVMKSESTENPLNSDNLLYITQAVSDANGNLEIPYFAKEQCENAVAFVKAISKTDLSSAQVTISDILCNGAEQFAEPEVILNDVSLVEGIDYDIEKRYSATYPGEYELVITGIRNYTGEVMATYKICCEHKFENGKCITCKSLNDTIGDANGDGVVGVADLVVLQDFLAVKRKDISVHADVNQDGVINVFDLSLLREIVSSVLS